VCAFILSFAAHAEGRSKIDPFLGTLKEVGPFKALSLNAPLPSDEAPIEIFLKVVDVQAAAATVVAAGGEVHTKLGSILTASVPPSAIAVLAEVPNIIYIEAAKPVKISNDVASAETGLADIHLGTDLPQGFDGSGIIVGVVDTGVDYRHADFRDDDGNSRVLAIWDQSKASNRGPSELTNTYGTECDRDDILDRTCTLNDVDGHGTHVAGIAASSDGTYAGAAPRANIVAVKYDARLDLESGYADTIFSTKICDAAYYIFAKAAQYGMPAVVNMSLGTHIGAHDGRSLFEECLSELTAGVAGRAIVAAAGNEYSGEWDYTGIHTGFTLVPEKEMATNFVIRNPSSDGVYYIDLWGAPASEISVGIAFRANTLAGAPDEFSGLTEPGATASGSFLSGRINYMINATDTDSALNGKPHVGIRILVDPTLSDIRNTSFDLVVKGSGSFDAWLFPDKPARTVQFTSVSGTKEAPWFYMPGDRENSIAIPATSPNIIAVGGYATRTKWTVGSLTWVFNGQQLGELLNFSSSGPTSDPDYTGQKPDIVAPGGMIASSKSSLAQVGAQVTTDDGAHYLQSGTSMASPYVSGTIALMFQANPNFTHGDVKRFLIQSAYVDNFVATAPDKRWGYGKLDAMKALEVAVNGQASGVFDANGSISSPEASASEEHTASCHLVANTKGPNSNTGIAIIGLFSLLIIRRRFRAVVARA
jgi:subtilisin family serine protease